MERFIYLAALLFFGVIFSSTATGGSLSQPYTLGPQDRIRVKVLEWLPSKGEYREWEALSGEYTITNSGAVMLPIVGNTNAQGRSSEQLAKALANGLQSRVGLVRTPDVSVEVVGFRSIFVLGDVEKPGEYPFRPRLTVLQAVGLAGGRYRPVDRLRDYGQDTIRQVGAIEGYRAAALRARVRLARLEAEAANLDEIVFPADFSATVLGVRAIVEEQAIFTTRATAVDEQLKALDDLKTLFDSEAAILESKIKTQEKQVSLLEEELAGARGLYQKKLTPVTRVRAIERSLSEMEGRRLDLTTSIMRARQKGTEAVRDALELRNDRKTRVAQALQETRAELEQTLVKEKVAQRLILEIGTSETADRERDAETRTIRYAIVRQVEGKGAVGIDVTENTPVKPGDTIKVMLQFGINSATGSQTSSFAAIPVLDKQVVRK